MHAMGAVDVAVLGPLHVRVDGYPVAPGGPKQRAVLAALAHDAGRPVTLDRLSEIVWDGDATDGASGTLRTYMANLRKLLEPTRPRRSGSSVLPSAGSGYLLDVGDDLDLTRFRSGQRAVRSATSAADLIASATNALDLWRGRAFADLAGSTFFDAAAHRLDEERLDMVTARVDALIELGQVDEAASDARVVLADHPYREPLWESLATALYRAGRQADALAAIAEARRQLLDGLGIDLGVGLVSLELDVLRQVPMAGRRPARELPSDAQPTVPASRHLGVAPASLILDDGRRVTLVGRAAVIGRSSSCTIPVDDARASREHAVIEVTTDAGWQIRDLGSLNGTLVNDEPVVSTRLCTGDRIIIGATRVTFITD